MLQKWYRTILLSLSMLMCTLIANAQNASGTVVDATGEPMIGVSVMVKGSSLGGITDLDGHFTIKDVKKGSTLVVSYIGFVSQEVKSGENLVIKLQEDNAVLNEVVVIGYQTVKRKDLTGAVASVNGKDLSSMPVSNAAQALQGKLPGVNVTTQDGRPGASVSIRVRGGGSISQSNEPLVLIDGVSGDLSDIPADQIESIDVLKDASSTAIYGARGANGVILVTTKGAKEGKVQVKYNGFVKLNTPTGYQEVLDPYDYLAYTWASAASVGGDSYMEPLEKLYGIGRYAGSNSQGINAYKNVKNADIQKQVYKTSFSHNHDLSLTGGTEKTKFIFSANYMDENGMKLESSFRRANVSVKVDQKINRNLSVSLDTRYTNVRSLGNSTDVLGTAYKYRPIATADILGDLDALNEGVIENYAKQSQWDRYNPEARIRDEYKPNVYQRLRAIGSLNWNIIKGLNYHTDIVLGQKWDNNRSWEGAIINSYIDDNTGEILYSGNASITKKNRWNLRWTNTLNYDFTPWKNHHFNVLVGHEISNSGGDDLTASGTFFPSNFTKDNAFAMINQYDASKGTGVFSSSVSTPDRMISYFGRLNYTLMERYLFTFTMRADGSSKFAPTKRWGYFPAAAAAWRIIEEPFMKDIKWMSNLKLRFSYGEVGNDGINSSLWAQTWSATSKKSDQMVFGNKFIPSYNRSTDLANTDLKWETTITRNLGLDFGFFDNRLTGSIEAYWNTTKDLLMHISIPGITGYTTAYANIGQTSNKGIELSLQGNIYSDKDWNISAGMNINFNKGNVDKLADNVTGRYGSNWASSSQFPTEDFVLQEGQPVGLIRGLVADGFYTTSDFTYADGIYTLKDGVADVSSAVFPNYNIHNGMTERPKGQLAYPGMAKFKDLNDDGVIDADDVDVIGNTNPTHTGGFNLNVTYKGFDLGMYFNWSVGNDIYNVNKLSNMYGYKEGGVYENRLSIVKNCYKIYDVVDGQLKALTTPEELNAANVNATLPLAYSENGYVSTLGIEDGSYLRLNTLTLGYSLPKSLLKTVGISSLRFYGSIYNVFTITGYSGLDPEVSTNTSTKTYPMYGMDWKSYPRPRSFVLGVNVTF